MLKKYRAEFLTFIIYLAAIIVVSSFHEPWYDEGQAWMIAKVASIKEILFTVPHYEGHPPLWHLILAPFAKLGAPYELSLNIVNIAFNASASVLIIFKAPFPKPVRCLIPFSFFCFYQYGVISRPYSMMMLAFVLAAMTYGRRDEKPLPFVLSLAFLCAAQFYGIVIAGMICVIWAVKIFGEYKSKDKKKLFTDKRCLTLLVLLIFALVLIYIILPAEDTYAAPSSDTLPDKLKNTYNILMIPFESIFGIYVNYFYTENLVSILVSCLGGCIVWFLTGCYAKKNGKLLEFTIPIFAFLLTYTYIYGSVHHMGIYVLYLIYFAWICEERAERSAIPEMLSSLFERISGKFLKTALKSIMVLMMAIPFLETIVSAVNEIRLPYFPSREIADLVKNNNLDDLKIMCIWKYTYDFGDLEREDILKMTDEERNEYRTDFPEETIYASLINPYFDKNIFMNASEYSEHKTYESESEEIFDSWQELGIPDVIMGETSILDEIYDNSELDGVKYVKIAYIQSYMIFKFSKLDTYAYIYMREDLLDDYPDLYEVDWEGNKVE